MTTTHTTLATPTPSYHLGQLVLDGGAGPYEIDGLRLEVAKYVESWAEPRVEFVEVDAPVTLHAVQPGWEYHLASRSRDAHGNERVRPWGWVGERELRGVE